MSSPVPDHEHEHEHLHAHDHELTSEELQLETASVLFMDIVEYSLQPVARQPTLLRHLQAVVQSVPEFKRANQEHRLISLPTGDGMALVFFDCPTVAVECALQICNQLKHHPEIRLRMGVHTGPVYRIADINANMNVAGGGINMAQRVMDCGDAGHVLVSRPVADFLSHVPGWQDQLRDIGEHKVKHGVSMHLFVVCAVDLTNHAVPAKLLHPPSGAVQPAGRLSRRWILTAAAVLVAMVAAGAALRYRWYSESKERYVAILPFRAVSGGDLVAVGLTDSLSTRLFQWQNIRMPSTAAVEALANLPVRRIARELGVRIIVRGTVQTDGDGVRVNVTVEDAENDKVLGRQILSGTRSRFIQLQDDVYTAVVRALNLRNSGATEPTETLAVASTNPKATDLYWKARQKFARQRSPEDVKEAIALYEESVRLDAGFARAWAYLSDAYVVLYRYTKNPSDAEQAVSAGQQACRLEDKLPEAHFALGYAQSAVGQTGLAISETRRALELAPNSAEGYRRLGRIYQDAGEKEQAIAAFKHAVELNPNYWNSQYQLASAYFRYGENANAAAQFQRVTEQVPERAEGFQGMGTAYLQMGDLGRSEAALTKALSIQERPTILAMLAQVKCMQGHYPEAIRLLQRAIELAPRQEVFQGNLGDAYRWSGNAEQARVEYLKAMDLASSDLNTNPRSAPTLASLALYSAKLGNSKDGQDYIQRALQIDPQNVQVLYNQAVVLALMGRHKEALGALEQAIKLGFSWKFAAVDPDLRSIRDNKQFQALARATRSTQSP